MACVLTNSKDFLNLVLKYDISSGFMELAIKSYLDKYGLEEYDPENTAFKQYIEDYFKLGDTNIYALKTDYEDALDVWNRLSSRFTVDRSLEDAKEFADSMVEFFGEENVIIFQTESTKEYRVRVAKPIAGNSSNSKKNTIFRAINVSQKNIKPGVSELFESNPELANSIYEALGFTGNISDEQKQQAQQWYSQYLDTIFPDSQVKDIVTHFSKNEFEVFDKSRQITGTLGKAFYFYPYISSKEEIEYEKIHGNNVRFSLLNINKLGVATDTKATTLQPLLDNNDGVQLNNTEIVVFEPEQIHILGSKQDLEGFKEFVGNNDNNESASTNDPKGKSGLEKVKEKVDKVIADFKRRVIFKEKEHEYIVDGEKANFSASTLSKGLDEALKDPSDREKFDEAWGVVSSRIGTTADTITRDFFNNTLKDSYANMTSEQLRDFKKDLEKLKAHFDKKFGKGNYGIVTEEFPIAAKYTIINSKGKPELKVIGGTMDMLIYDAEGNFYIYDMKTTRSGINESSFLKYSRQLEIYKQILEAAYPEIFQGRIKELKLILIQVGYPAPFYTDKETQEKVTLNGYMPGDESLGEDPLQVYINSEIGERPETENDPNFYTSLQHHREYIAPHMLFIDEFEDTLIDTEEVSIEGQFESLTTEEKSWMEDELNVKNGKVQREKPEEAYQLTEEEMARSAIFNPYRISAQERTFLANTVMKLASIIITHLEQNQSAKETYFPDGEYNDVDFTTMSREEILNTVNINSIFNIIREQYFNTSWIEGNPEILDKLDLIYDNWGALMEIGNNAFIMLEGRAISKIVEKDSIKMDTGNDSLDDQFTTDSLEEKVREYWQIGQRQVSAKSGLSAEIRRIFEKLPVLDAEGNQMMDPYGFGLPLFVDSDVAVNSILNWIKDARTMEDMENILKKMSTSFPWVNSILNKIKEEPFRSQFYTNFRKDFINYSIIVADTAADGTRAYKVMTINVKGSVLTILDEVSAAFLEGEMSNIIKKRPGDIEGKGEVNIEEIKKLASLRYKIFKDLNDARKTHSKKALRDAIKKSIPEVTHLLRELGIHVTEDIIEKAFNQDIKALEGASRNEVTLKTTLVSSLLSQINNILNTITEQHNRNNTEYNPLLKTGNSKGNVYSNYKDIATKLSDFIESSIESSSYENGKLYYSFNTPSYLKGVVTSLSNALGNDQKFEEYLQKNYGDYKWFKNADGTWNNVWLNMLANEESKRANFEHKVQLSFETRKGRKTAYEDLSEVGYTMSLLNEYFYDTHKNWAWYRVPILSDKPSSEFIKFVRYSKDYQRYISEGMMDVFNQEVMRMKTVLERAVEIHSGQNAIGAINNFDAHKVLEKYPELVNKIKNKTLTLKDILKNGKNIFAGTGVEFKFLDMFNEDLLTEDSIVSKVIFSRLNASEQSDAESKQQRDNDEVLLLSAFPELLKNHMNTLFEREVKNWENMGLFEEEIVEVYKNGKKEEVTRYKHLQHLGENREEILDNLEEYVWNDMFATINIIQLTVTDLAYYKNVEDFQKRYAQVHSPAMKLNIHARDYNNNLYSKDGIERTIYLKDSFVVSSIIPQVKAVFDKKVKDKEMTQFQADTLLSKYGYFNYEDESGKYVKSVIKDGKKDKIVLIPSEEINIADGLGYSSPTSYRKKMGMAGRWTPEMEAAYTTIREGKWNGEDLKVVWQPLKPFVYSQIKKASGASTMSSLKVPVQNKNSEYLLLLADAILRGEGNNTNKLSAIYDFMEDSAVDGYGIDTVQFETAVKSGLQGAVDINEATTYDEVLEVLNNAAYIDDTTYDTQTVHEIPFEDYGIQQEVPAHYMDHKQPMGSLMRILSISDISSDATFNVHRESKAWTSSELVENYQRLIAENIESSFKKLIKEFKIEGTRILQNATISKMLIDAMQGDLRYGADLKYAVSLNTQGEFNIPLSDPILSVRILQLLNSIIKSRINKQSVSGGPVVQVSVFGMSDDLNIVWKGRRGETLMTKNQWENSSNNSKTYEDYLKKNLDSDNPQIAHFEAYIPIPSSMMEEALTKPDGTLMDIDEALKKKIIHPEQLKAIGYRIPTEDKYSMVPIKVKGFLPKSAGEGIMLPKEITLLSGADFDIDKMYIMVKDFRKNEEEIDYEAIAEDLIKDKKLQRRFKDQSTIAFSENIERILDEILDAEVEMELKPGTPEKYIYEYVQNNKDKYAKATFSEKRNVNTKSGRNNRIFDIQWSVLVNSDTSEKLFNPGSFEPLKKSARIITILKDPNINIPYSELKNMSLEELSALVPSSSNRNIVYSTTLIYLHKQNMTAAKLIGVFANHNTSHAFISLQDIAFNVPESFNFDGTTIGNQRGEVNKLDNQRALDGSTLVSKNIAGFLAASVDAVKDPVLNFLNLNTFTANPAMVLARLGFDVDSISLLLTQPIIEKITNEYFMRNNERYTSPEEIIDEELSKFSDQPKMKDLQTNQFLKEDLARIIADNSGGRRMGNKDKAYQALVLLLFKNLITMGQNLGELTFLTKFNSVTNAVGPTIADTLVIKQRYDKFLDNMTNPTSAPPFSDSAASVIDNSPILSAFYESTIGDNGASRLLFLDYFPHYSDTFLGILSDLRRSIKGTLDSKTINQLINDFIVFKLTMANVLRGEQNPVFDSSYENRRRLLYDFVDKFKENTEHIENNELINIIKKKPRTEKIPITTLEAKTGGFSADTQEKIKDAWSTLIGDDTTADLALDLFYYNMLRSGFDFSPKTFMHLASTIVKMLVPGYIENIADVNFNDDRMLGLGADFLTMFRRNHSSNFRIVPNLDKNSKLKVGMEKTLDQKNVLYTFNFNKNKNLINPITLLGEDSFAPMITYDDTLLVYHSHGNGFVQYVSTSPLGNNNNAIEYDANMGGLEMVSAISEAPLNMELSEDTTPTKDLFYDENLTINLDNAYDTAVEGVLTEEEIAELDEIDDDKKAKEFVYDILEGALSEESETDIDYEERVEQLETLMDELEKVIKNLC